LADRPAPLVYAHCGISHIQPTDDDSNRLAAHAQMVGDPSKESAAHAYHS